MPDPDVQVRETLHHFFDTFTRVGSVSQTVKVFHKEGILFPSRLHNSETLFRPLTVSTAQRTLTNPRYAGAYAYGRRQYRRNYEGGTVIHNREMNDWLACIPDAHPGYINWETHQVNLGILRENGHGYQVTRASLPREGAALLQGRAVCGQCGRHLRVRYATRRGRQEIWYICDRAQQYQGGPHCQSIAGQPVDEAVSLLIAEQMAALSVELTLAIRREIEKTYEEADSLRCCAIEHARTQADLAQRRFMQVDPDNRLVADTLESEWNEKLRILASAREERERASRHD
ncbi:recombinase zinc beta ribbon domain-containing protein [Salmonella enterica]